MRVLFVCSGNTCRSPMAEAMLRSAATRARFAAVRAASAGIACRTPGGPASAGAIAEMARRGIDLAAHRQRRFAVSMIESCDHVLAMDRSVLRSIETMVAVGDRPRAALLLDFAPGLSRAEVPDPYDGSDEDYRYAADLIAAGIDGLLMTATPPSQGSGA